MSDTPQGPGWWQASDGKWYPPEQTPGGASTGNNAEWVQRVIAFLIDAALVVPLYVITFILAIVGSVIADALGVLFLTVGYLAIIAFVIYNLFVLQGKTGQTVGKRLVGIKIISEETRQPLPPVMNFVRYLAHFLDQIICYIGYFMPLWDAKKQTIADKVMKTVVVEGAQKYPFNAELFKL